MRVILTILLGLSSAAHAWDPGKDLKRIGKDIEKGVDHLGKEIGKEADKIKDGGVKYRPVSQTIPPEQMPKDDTFWMAVVGDSSVTGAVASPSFRATVHRIGQLAWSFLDRGRADDKMEARYQDYSDPTRFNILNPPAPLTRVLYTRAEFDRYQNKRQAFELEKQSQFSAAIDTEELAFPYLIGRALNIPASLIILTAQDGRKINAMSEQLDRIFETGVKTLPPLVLISFVANDMCHPDNFSEPLTHFSDTYRESVRAQLRHAGTLPPAKGGTRLVFVGPMSLADLLVNPALLDQPVKFENGSGVTCRSIRDGSGVKGLPAQLVQKRLIGSCRGILKPSSDSAGQLQRVRDMQTAQYEILTEAIAEFNAGRTDQSMVASLATSTRDLQFRRGDVGHDCFHPSPAGHAFIADQLLRNEFSVFSGAPPFARH